MRLMDTNYRYAHATYLIRSIFGKHWDRVAFQYLIHNTWGTSYNYMYHHSENIRSLQNDIKYFGL